MSSSTKQLQKFFVYAPDSQAEGTRARRYEVRPRHMDGVAPLIKAGIIQVGGMLLDPELHDDSDLKPAVGSILIVKAESLSEVKAMIESDIYYTSGVWDREKLLILPFIPATPFPP